MLPSDHSGDASASVINAILASDLAADIGREVAELCSFGVDMTSITQQIITTFSDALRDPQHGPVVLVALAAAQFRENQLHDTIRDAALAVIDSGEAAAAFAAQHADVRSQRLVLLQQLAQLLRSVPSRE